MASRNKKIGVFDNSKEPDVYKKLKEGGNKELIGFFLEYFKKDFEKSLFDFLDLTKREGGSIPDTILTKKLTVLESIVKYLKENLNFSYKEIARLLNRDQRNIWQTYNAAKKKHKLGFAIKHYKFLIPSSIFSNRKLSILENLVFYLKNEFNLSYHKIAILIHRDERTVWTVYQKALRKHAKR